MQIHSALGGSSQNGHVFPLGTFTVNVLGFVLYAASAYGMISRTGKLLLATGFAGAFTTFSTFSFEAFELASEGMLLMSALYVAASLVLGWIGVYIGEKLAVLAHSWLVHHQVL